MVICGVLCTKLISQYFGFALHLYVKMWYEILPSFCIIMAGVGLPGWGLYHIHKLTIGNHFRRTMIERWDRHTYQRDYRLTGNPYDVKGLESIPDAEEK